MIIVSVSWQKYFFILGFLILVATPFILSYFKKQKVNKEITFWYYWSGEEKEPLENLIEKFNQEDHGFKIKGTAISMARKKILTSIVGKVAPDLAHLDGDMVTDFALRDALTDLNKFMDEDYKENFTPIFLDMLNIKNQQWALPLLPSCEAMHVNLDLARQLRFSIPETLDDVVSAFNRGYQYNDFQSFLPNWPPWFPVFIPVAFQGRWAEIDKDGKWHITANSPNNLRAWLWIEKNFVGKIPAAKTLSFTEGFSAYQSPDNPFYAGKIAIETSGVWEYNLAKIYSPKMSIAVAPFPSEKPLATYVSVDALAIPKNAKHKKEAFYFMKWLLQQENLEYLALAQKKFTPLKNHSEEFFTKHENPYINIFIELAQSPNAIYFPQLPFVSRYKTEIKKAYDRVIRQQLGAQQALDNLQKVVVRLQEDWK